MIRGIIRWYVPEAEEWQTRTDLFNKLNELQLSPMPWSSRTVVLRFPDDAGLAKVRFAAVQTWLGNRFANTQQRFRAIFSVTIENGYAEF